MVRRLRDTTSVEIRNRIRLLNLLISFVIFSLLFVILRYLYNPLHEFFRFLPDTSMALILISVGGLAAIGLYLSKVLSGQVIRSIEDYSARLDSLLNITKELREERYGDILLDKIMDSSLAITSSDAGSILLVDNDNLIFKVVKGVKEQELRGKTVPKDRGICGWVLNRGEPVLIEDAEKDERFDASVDEFTGYQTNSMLCTPLKTKSSIIGVIELLNKKQGVYNERDLAVISYLADQAAISLEKVKFYDDQKNYEIHLTDIMLDTIDRFIPEKHGHSKRVAKYASIMAKAIDMPEERQRRLYFASLLHDIGFLRLSYENSAERETYTKHPKRGYEMLSPISFYKDIAQFVLYHHERYDGTGYPEKLKGNEIPLESRMIFIAEAFDSMVSSVSYKVPVNFEYAISELVKNKGKQFDSELVDLFLDNIKLYLKTGILPVT